MSKRIIGWLLESSRAWSFFARAFTKPTKSHARLYPFDKTNQIALFPFVSFSALLVRFHFKVIRKSLHTELPMTDLLLKGIARIRMTTKVIFTLYRRAFRADTKSFPVWYQWTPIRYANLPFKRSARRSLAPFSYDPTTATSIKSSLKDRLRILFNHFAIILSRPITKKKETFVGTDERGLGRVQTAG